MKRSIRLWIGMVLTVLSLAALASWEAWAEPKADAGFLALDAAAGRVEVFGPDFKTLTRFAAAPGPRNVVPAAADAGYWLLCAGAGTPQGRIRSAGVLLHLGPDLKPDGGRFKLPGLVLRDFYLKDRTLWIIVSAVGEGKNQTAAVTLFDLRSGTARQADLNSLPSCFQLDPARQRLAVGTLGISGQVQPELALLNLQSLALNTYPVGLNPGAIFFLDADSALVVSGGYRPRQSYPDELLIAKASQPVPATLHLIRFNGAPVCNLAIGLSPVAVVRDRTDPSLFYIASSSLSSFDQAAGAKNPHDGYSYLFAKQDKNAGNAPAENSPGTLYKIRGGQILAQTGLPFEPTNLLQAPDGHLCVTGWDAYGLADTGLRLLSQADLGLRLDGALLKEHTAYFTVANSSTLHAIDLAGGKPYPPVKLSNFSFFGTFRINDWLGGDRTMPPVVGATQPAGDPTVYPTANQRLLSSPSGNEIYALSSSADLGVVDAASNSLRRSIALQGYPYGLQLTPNGRYLVVATELSWHLIQPDQARPVLSVMISPDGKAPQTGFYSPDGRWLAIPYEYSFYVLDTESAKLVGKFPLRSTKPVLIWPVH